jgi:hypothetical protein
MPDYEKKLIKERLTKPKELGHSYAHHAWVTDQRYKEQQRSRSFGGVDLKELAEKSKKEKELRAKENEKNDEKS